MLKSTRIFLKQFFKNIWFWLTVCLTSYRIFDLFKDVLPEYMGRYMKMIPSGVIEGLIFIFIIIASFSVFHKLRIARLSEFYKFSPEANKDRIFRMFYKLYKEGELLKDSGTTRRQSWDEKVLKEIKSCCTNEFEHLYLSSTNRRNQTFSPLKDEDYNKALVYIKDFLDSDFDTFVKT